MKFDICEFFRISIKIDKNEDQTFLIISPSVLIMKNFAVKVVDKIKTHRPQLTIWRMRIACLHTQVVSVVSCVFLGRGLCD